MTTTVDALAIVGPNRFGGALLDPLDVQRDWDTDVVVCAPAVPPDRDLPSANARLLELAEDSPRIAVLSRVDPHEAEALAEVARAAEHGACGVLLHPWEETFAVTDRRLLDPLMAALGEARLPLVLEAGFPWVSEPAQVGALASRHPSVTVVATRGLQMNMSGLATQTAFQVLEANPNLHCLTCGTYRQDWLQQLLDGGLGDRLLYGSLAPVFDPSIERLRLQQLRGSGAQLRAVLAGNARRVFGIPG